MAAWEPQIRTHLDDEIYAVHLDKMLRRVPEALAAGLVNIRFREACLRLPGDVPASPAGVSSLVALTAGLFGNGEAANGGANDLEAFTAAMQTVHPVELAYLGAARESILITRLTNEDLVLVLTVAASLNQGACMNLLRAARDQVGALREDRLARLLEAGEVLSAVLVDPASGTFVATFEAYQGASHVALDERILPVVHTLFTSSGAPSGLRFYDHDGEQIEIRRAELAKPSGNLHWSRIPFDPDHLLVLNAEPTALRGLVWSVMKSNEVETVRLWVDGLLAYGVKSTMFPFPHTNDEFMKIVGELRELPENDLLGRLDIGGFANHEVVIGEDNQRCQECIYYLPRSRWCDLPELPIPVEAHWWCRLWKV